MVACQYITGDSMTKWHQLENFHSLKNAGRKVSDLRPEGCCQVCPLKVDTPGTYKHTDKNDHSQKEMYLQK